MPVSLPLLKDLDLQRYGLTSVDAIGVLKLLSGKFSRDGGS
jgi:hypothetical protein